MGLAGDAGAKPVSDRASRTMGRQPGSLKPDVNNHLTKKDNKIKSLKELKETEPDKLKPTSLKPSSKPPVPKIADAPVCNLVTSKNFIVANAVETILAAPKQLHDGQKDYL